MLRKRLSKVTITLLIRSLNWRNHTSVMTVEHQDTLIQIAISGLLLNKAIVYHPLEVKINFKTLWLLLELLQAILFLTNFNGFILLLILLSRGLRKRKLLLPPNLLFGRKKTPLSDSSTYLAFLVCMLFWVSLVLLLFDMLVCLFYFLLLIDPKKKKEKWKIQK